MQNILVNTLGRNGYWNDIHVGLTNSFWNSEHNRTKNSVSGLSCSAMGCNVRAQRRLDCSKQLLHKTAIHEAIEVLPSYKGGVFGGSWSKFHLFCYTLKSLMSKYDPLSSHIHSSIKLVKSAWGHIVFRELAAGLSQQRPGFHPRSVHVRFVVSRLGQG